MSKLKCSNQNYSARSQNYIDHVKTKLLTSKTTMLTPKLQCSHQNYGVHRTTTAFISKCECLYNCFTKTSKSVAFANRTNPGNSRCRIHNSGFFASLSTAPPPLSLPPPLPRPSPALPCPPAFLLPHSSGPPVLLPCCPVYKTVRRLQACTKGTGDAFSTSCSWRRCITSGG